MSVLGYLTSNRIMLQRKKKKLTQRELCEKIGDMTGKYPKRQTISSWEKGVTSPDLLQLQALSNIFGCSIGYLLGEINEYGYGAKYLFDNTGLSEKALNTLYMLSQSDNKESKLLLEIITQFIENDTLLSCLLCCCTLDFGKEPFMIGAWDTMQNRDTTTTLEQELLLANYTMKTHKFLCEFIESIRSKSL